MSFIDNIRFATDSGQGILAQKEMSSYQCSLVQIFSPTVSFDDSAGGTRLETPLYVGAPIGPNLNPHIQYLVKMDNNGVSVLSAAALTEMELMMGPIVFPYTVGNVSGGYDPSIFNGTINKDSHLNVFVRIKGIGLNPDNGNYFKVKEVVLNGMDSTFYYVKLIGVSDVV